MQIYLFYFSYTTVDSVFCIIWLYFNGLSPLPKPPLACKVNNAGQRQSLRKLAIANAILMEMNKPCQQKTD